MAALIAPIDRVKATVRPSIAGSRTVAAGRPASANPVAVTTGVAERRGRPGSTRAWIVIVMTPRAMAQIVSALRQPRASCSAAIVGWKIVEANPATSVRVVIAHVARRPNPLISTTCAGSYSTRPMATPISSHDP